jgi:hypothetical protein
VQPVLFYFSLPSDEKAEFFRDFKSFTYIKVFNDAILEVQRAVPADVSPVAGTARFLLEKE